MPLAAARTAPILHWLRNLAPGLESQVPDDELLRRFVQKRDEGAFCTLLRRHAELVYGVCLRNLRDPEDAEDAFQATFLALALKGGAIRQGQALTGWLYKVAYRVALAARRSKASRRTRTAVGDEMANIPARGAPPDLNDLSAVLDEEVIRLPEKCRIPFLIVHLQGLSRSEAAERIRISIPTLDRRLAEARKLLQARLIARGLTTSAVLTASAMLGTNAFAVAPRLITESVQVALRVLVGGGSAGAIPASVLALAAAGVESPWLGSWKVIGLLALLLATGSGVSAVCLEDDRPMPTAVTRLPAVVAPPSRPNNPEELRQSDTTRASSKSVHSAARQVDMERVLREKVVPEVIAALESLGGKAEAVETSIDRGTARVTVEWRLLLPQPSKVILGYQIEKHQFDLQTDLFSSKLHPVDPERPIIFSRVFGHEITMKLDSVQRMQKAFEVLRVSGQ